MLVNLTPINSFETEMEIHTKNLNRYFSGFTIKKRRNGDMKSIIKYRFMIFLFLLNTLEFIMVNLMKIL